MEANRYDSICSECGKAFSTSAKLANHFEEKHAHISQQLPLAKANREEAQAMDAMMAENERIEAECDYFKPYK